MEGSLRSTLLGGASLGGKSITLAGGLVLNINNIMGPAMVALPFLNQSAGWLSPTLVLMLCCCLSAMASTMLCEAMQRIPGNRNFDAIAPNGQRYEFCDVILHYYGLSASRVGQIFFNLSLQASNIAAMVVTAQIFDDIIVFMTGHGAALRYDTWPPQIYTVNRSDLKHADLWPTPWCLSVGLFLSMAGCVPFGMLSLEENMWFQVSLRPPPPPDPKARPAATPRPTQLPSQSHKVYT